MIQFIDLKAQYARIQDKVEEATIRVLRNGQYIMGPEVAEFEQKLANFVGVRHAISCSSGTDALVVALMAKGIGPGDAIFTVPFTFMASAEAIATVGATPIFVDIEPATFNLDPACLARAVDAMNKRDPSRHPLPRLPDEELRKLRPRGVLAVDLFGLPADYRAISTLAAAHDLFVIEDAAQSFGGSRDNGRAGALAEIACTSFFPAKPLGCYGDGGAIFTDDDQLASVMRSIRVHGQGAHKYENVRLGMTARLDTVQAAILQVKLEIFADELEERQRVADRYSLEIERAGLDLVTPALPAHASSAWAQYTVVAKNSEARAEFQTRLGERGVPTMIYYPKPLHLQAAFAPLGYAAGDFPVSEDLADRVFSLPMHPYLSDEDISQIVAAMAA